MISKEMILQRCCGLNFFKMFSEVSSKRVLIIIVHDLLDCILEVLSHYGSHPFIFLFLKAIAYPRILTIHNICISLSMVLPWIDCCILQISKTLPGPQERLIRIRLLIGLLFQYIYHYIQNIFLQMSVGLSSS